MDLVTLHIRWIMLIAGVLTCTMAMAAFDPHSAMLSLFGESMTARVRRSSFEVGRY